MDSILQLLSSSVFLVAQAAVGAAGNSVPNELPPPWHAWLYNAAIVFAIFVLPFILSKLFAKALRMPAHSFRIGIMLAAIIGGFVFAYQGVTERKPDGKIVHKPFQMKLGPDMKGGTNLVYQIVDDGTGAKIDADALAVALTQRLNPSGTQEISIRAYGDSQIEIIVPNVDEFEIEEIKKKLRTAGALKFRIVANTRDHLNIIEFARQQAQKPERLERTQWQVKNAEGKVVGEWYDVGRQEKEKAQNGIIPLRESISPGDTLRNKLTGQLIPNTAPVGGNELAFERWLVENNIQEIEQLMALERAGMEYKDVTGGDLALAAAELDSKTGEPTVRFMLKTEGAARMLALTAANGPDPNGGFKRRMAIILDRDVISAPQLNSAISNSGVITGNFTQSEVDFLVTILKAGQLPATLSSDPTSETRVGASLGATTVQKGMRASIFAVMTTFACILLYYRFSGVVAAIALLINGLLIWGVMIFIGQPLTLPGLAGLALTMGMSVDANVLVFERIREEVEKGTSKRLAIRNGFDRALTTIIDSNLTTIIAAVVLYWIGTDQVRGFAVALIIGILISMFTATFCSRLIFEICERLNIVNLAMSDGIGFLKKTFLGQQDFDFVGKTKYCVAFSLTLIALGFVGVFIRGKDLLNIDFTGGTSVTLQVESPIDAEELRQLTRKILDVDENGKPIQSTLVLVEQEPINTVYTLVTSIGKQDYLQQKLVGGFAKENVGLVTYKIKVEDLKAKSGFVQPRNAVRFVAFQNETQAEVNTAAEVNSATNAAQAASQPGTAGSEANTATASQPEVSSQMDVNFFTSTGTNAKIDGPTLRQKISDAAKNAGLTISESLVFVEPIPVASTWSPDDVSGHDKWHVVLPYNEAQSQQVIQELQGLMVKQPVWLSLSNIGTRIAGEMQEKAIGALLLSLVFIVAYIWFRFQKVAYGLAAVVALVHDVVITLGVMALCHWLAGPLKFLMIEDFKIGLTEVAAFLTIIGYSLNDTIVVFDRIREVRGKSPQLTDKMINDSVNQTLSRTLLTSGTTILTLAILYWYGGEGIHAFSFVLLFGIVIGTYSSVFIASPILLWLSRREFASAARPSALPQPR